MNSPRSAASPAYETAMEDLAKLLQDTGSSVERILSSFSAASTKSLGPKLSDVRTSLSIGITPSTLEKRGDISSSEAHNLLHKEDPLVSAFGPGQFHTAGSKAAQHQHDVQNWFAQVHPDKAGHGKIPVGVNALSFNIAGTSSDEDVLKVFLEEMKKTICDWSARQKVLVPDKAGSVKSIAHAGTPVSSALGLPNGTPLSLGFNKEQSLAANTKALGGQGVKEVLGHQNEKDVEKTIRVSPQQDKGAEQSLFKTEIEKSARLDKVVNDIASQLLQSDDEDTHTNHLKQTPEANTQNPSEKEKAAQMPTAAHVGAEEGSTSQATTLATEGNAANAPTPGEVTPIADSFITPTKTDEAAVKLPLTKWKPPTSAVKNIDKNLSFPRTVEVINSPDWLPEGWVTELKTRGSGNSAGSKDKYYVDPVSNRRFRSRKEVAAHLERGKPKLSDSPETSPIKKLLGPELLPSLPKKSHKKTKIKASSAPSSSGLPPPMVPSIGSPGLVGNMFMPPFRTGQPSEWLLYESLASLPFPMFDPFYYADMGANKSSSSKSSHMPTRPWFFSGPEASWSPFMDRASLGKSGDKGRDYHSYFSMPPYSSEAVPKPSAGGGKKSSKRKSADL